MIYRLDSEDLEDPIGFCLDVPRRATWVSFKISIPPLRKSAKVGIFCAVDWPETTWRKIYATRARVSRCRRHLVIWNESLAPLGIKPGDHLHFRFDVPKDADVKFFFEAADA